jgi:hypothetical protein
MQTLPWIVINLKHRTDRMELLQKTFFPNKGIERFEAIQHEDPEHGCRDDAIVGFTAPADNGGAGGI